jgi:hypothetical protein
LEGGHEQNLRKGMERKKRQYAGNDPNRRCPEVAHVSFSVVWARHYKIVRGSNRGKGTEREFPNDLDLERECSGTARAPTQERLSA